MEKREFKVLDDRTHVLLRPAMYLGGVSLIDREQWVLNRETNKFEYKSVKVVPALLKCASEIIDNSIDVAIDTNFTYANKISVKVDDRSIEVTDNGIGIPVDVPKNSDDDKTCVELAWTKLKAGTSFSDKQKKIGANGLGSACVNIFSKVFEGHSDDGKKQQTISCRDNMAVVKAGKIKPSSGKPGVKVYLEPDLNRFGLTSIDQTHIDLIYQRLVGLAISYPKIKFTFNGKQISLNEKKFAEMFSDDSVTVSSDNTTICVFPNEYDEFKFFTQVNGIDMFRGGTHIDYVTNEICGRIRDKLVKKYKTLRPGDVKTKLCVAVMLTDFVNPETDAQTKESLKNTSGDIGRHIDGKIDFDKFVKDILKREAIIDPIVETFKIKEELKARQELKKVKKAKVRSDKYLEPTGEHKYLALCEGASAKSGISACLGRDEIGYYAMRGVPLNAYDSSIQKISSNQELKDIVNILGLDISKGDEPKTIDFERVLITSDNDADGIHITSMLIGWFKRFAPNLFTEGKICKLITPLIILTDKDGKIDRYFFNVQDFKKWESSNPNSKLKVIYQKGLGSWEKKDLDYLIKTEGFDRFVQQYKLDKDGEVYIEDWLGADAEKRKEYLRNYQFDINQA